MLNRLFILLLILVFISCGKDVVEIIDTPIPNEPQEIFEVNIIGFSTDSKTNFIENVDLTVDNKIFNTGSTSFFIENSVFVGKEGSVISGQKEGFLPIFKRVYHHRSLEDVVVNVTLVDSPIAQNIGISADNIVTEDGSELSFGEQTFSQSTDVVFYSAIEENQRLDFDPLITSDESVEILAKEAMFYIESTSEMSTDAAVTINVVSDRLPDTNLGVYYYDESALTWKLSNTSVREENGNTYFDIDKFGWWALGTSLSTTYGKLTINQHDHSFTGIASLRDSEVIFSKVGNTTQDEHLFTNTRGEIHKYYPTNINQEISINNRESAYDLNIEFTEAEREIEYQIDKLVSQRFSFGVFDCQLDKQLGYVAMISEDGFRIRKIEEGRSLFFTNVSYDNMEFRFYGQDEALLSVQNIEPGEINNPFFIDDISFVACNQGMQVENEESSVLQSFDQCKIRIKPIESFIVGDDSITQFFIAFKGDEVGVYDGLVFADDVPSFEVQNVKKDVKVDIMIYDKVTGTIAGFVDGEYKNGDKYKVSFIGNIEE